MNNKTIDFKLNSLPPTTYEFKSEGKNNRIDYWFSEGDFVYQKKEYIKLKAIVAEKADSVTDLQGYTLYSMYIYKKTDILNANYDKGREGLDGHNQDLLAYIRFNKGKMDVFYILKDGNVIYDAVSGKAENFEFEQ
ncbi:hypothetical protein [Kaistella jeonii]|nr:hypothetical protein [Kaistella jeonii]SFC44240.1 hypothetical protein SAMN05421876_1253 [Kaistella jeonii]VEI97372.1 Uncharacterised protein [Kaistella jeonii]